MNKREYVSFKQRNIILVCFIFFFFVDFSIVRMQELFIAFYKRDFETGSKFWQAFQFENTIWNFSNKYV